MGHLLDARPPARDLLESEARAELVVHYRWFQHRSAAFANRAAPLCTAIATRVPSIATAAATTPTTGAR
eukprot:3871942-Prymnesium_polylepis.1